MCLLLDFHITLFVLADNCLRPGGGAPPTLVGTIPRPPAGDIPLPPRPPLPDPLPLPAIVTTVFLSRKKSLNTSFSRS